MAVTIEFEFGSEDSFREPVRLHAESAILPAVGDVVLDHARIRHRVAGRIFEWDGMGALFVTLECLPREAGPLDAADLAGS